MGVPHQRHTEADQQRVTSTRRGKPFVGRDRLYYLEGMERQAKLADVCTMIGCGYL